MRRGWLLCATLAASGCDQVFTLDRADALAACWDPRLTGNEDGDGHVDGCDPCPADVDTSMVVNGDADELGDSCDPQMGTRQSLVAFDGFEAASGWMVTSGMWEFTGGELAHTNPLGSGLIEWTIEPTRHPGADVQFDGQLNGAVTMGAGVLLDLGAINVECSFEARTNGNADRFVLRIDSAVSDEVDADASGLTRIQLFQDSTGVFRCRGARGVMAFRELETAPLTQTTAAKLMLQATLTTARFQSVTVFSTD